MGSLLGSIVNTELMKKLKAAFFNCTNRSASFFLIETGNVCPYEELEDSKHIAV